MRALAQLSVTATVLALLLAAAALAAGCGGSSKSTEKDADSKSSLLASPAYTRRFQALRECLSRQGMVLPKRSKGPGVGGFLGSGNLPRGVSQAKFEAALRRCGGLGTRPASPRRAGGRLSTPAARRAFSSFVSCMRGRGVALPAPNLSGRGGPIFNTKGLNTASFKFRSAEAACGKALRALVLGQPEPGSAPGAGR